MATDLAQRLHARSVGRPARSYRCDCPACAYHNAFSIRPGQNGNALVWCANGCTREALHATLARVAGGGWTPPEARQPADTAAQREKRQAAALRLWAGSTTALGTLGDAYLTGRGLPGLAASPALRFRSDAPHPIGGRFPALFAAVVDVTGEQIGLHRTFLAVDGRGKANVEPAKASIGPIWGGAIRLQENDPDRPLVIGEGIETAASAGMLMGLPAWAAISAGNMAKGLELPPDVRQVVIAVDPDLPGQRAAAEAADRWQREGRRVRLAKPQGCGDFNDLLRAGGHHG